MKKITDIFKSDKKRFRERIKREKNKIYLRRKQSSPLKKKRNKKILQFHFEFKKKSIVSFSIIIFITTLIWLVYIFKGHYFSVQYVEVNSESKLIDTNLIYKNIDSIRWKSIFSIDSQKIKKTIITYQKNISWIKLQRVLPHNVNITVSSFPIIAKINYLHKDYLLSSNGIVIPDKKQVLSKNIPLISLIDKKKKDISSFISYKKILEESTIKRILLLQKLLTENLLDFKIQHIIFYKTEQELHISLPNKTLLIFDVNWDIHKQIKKLIVFYKNESSLQKVYFDLRIPDKIFYCWNEMEYQCKKNLSYLYN